MDETRRKLLIILLLQMNNRQRIAANAAMARRRKRRREYLQHILEDHINSVMDPIERLPRSCQAYERGSGMWGDMIHVWPTYGAEKEDKEYYKKFRLNKTTFYDLYESVKGTARATFSIFAAHLQCLALCLGSLRRRSCSFPASAH